MLHAATIEVSRDKHMRSISGMELINPKEEGVKSAPRRQLASARDTITNSSGKWKVLLVYIVHNHWVGQDRWPCATIYSRTVYRPLSYSWPTR